MILHWLVCLTVLSFALAVPANDQEDAGIEKLKESFLKLMKAVTAESTRPCEKREKRGVEVPGVHDEHLSNLVLELVSLLRTTIPGPAYCLNETYATPCNETGSPGIPGPPGAPGPKGETGEVGPAGLNGTNGDEGPVGPTGIPGLKGEKGIAGSVGAKGARGTQGSVGTKGDKGEKEISGLHLRLAGGSGPHEGRVEVRSNPYGEWGTVCDDVWEIQNANVVCRSLGYHRGALSALSLAYFGQGSGDIWLDHVGCTGKESNLAQCYHKGWGVHHCGHHEDASVICRRSLCPTPFQEITIGSTKKCVFVSTATSSWASAQQYCQNQGSYLVTFRLKSESAAFGNYLHQQDPSSRWWIGGQKIGSTWYWRGIFTGLIPEYGTTESGWHDGHDESSEPPCMYFQTASPGEDNNGWNSHASEPCSNLMKHICERAI